MLFVGIFLNLNQINQERTLGLMFFRKSQLLIECAPKIHMNKTLLVRV